MASSETIDAVEAFREARQWIAACEAWIEREDVSVLGGDTDMFEAALGRLGRYVWDDTPAAVAKLAAAYRREWAAFQVARAAGQRFEGTAPYDLDGSVCSRQVSAEEHFAAKAAEITAALRCNAIEIFEQMEAEAH